MEQERKKVLQMLADGYINAPDAQLLLDTLQELQELQDEQVFGFFPDVGRLKMMLQEYGRIPKSTIPQIPPTPYFAWYPV